MSITINRLLAAVMKDNQEMVAFLLKKGAFSCHHWVETINYFIDHVNDPGVEESINMFDETAESTINRQNREHGDTPLHISARKNLIRTVTCLLKTGAVNTSIRNNDGLTAEELARSLGNNVVAEMIAMYEQT